MNCGGFAIVSKQLNLSTRKEQEGLLWLTLENSVTNEEKSAQVDSIVEKHSRGGKSVQSI